MPQKENLEVLDTVEAKDDFIEGEILPKEDEPELTPQQIKMKELSSYRTKARPPSKKERRINVTKVCNEMGYNPAVTLIHIAQNNYKQLGLTKPVTAHEINSAAQSLLSYTTPNFKPIEYEDPDKEIKQIPVFVPKRGVIAAPTETPEEMIENIPSLTEGYGE